jgi:putative oxidoreductase
MTTETKAPGMMTRMVLKTRPSWSGLILRLTLALVIFPHGAQKVLGWYGGYGWSGTMTYLTGAAGLPTAIAALVMLIEFFAPLALVLGLFTRGAVVGLIAVMLGAIMKVHLSNGFFMNWSNAPARGEGYEYHLLVIGMAVALFVSGAGSCSLDHRISNKP